MDKQNKRLSLSESARLFGRALKVSIQARGAVSIIVSLIGFAAAFLPMLIAAQVRRLSDEAQALFGSGEAAAVGVLGAFAVLAALYVVQMLWNQLRGYFDTRDAQSVQMFIKERTIRAACNVKYKYIENFDDFKERIRFIDTQAGERVAQSVGTTITWLQNIITLISIITVLWAVDPLIVAILVLAIIPTVIIAYKFSEDVYYSTGFWILDYLMTCAYMFESTWQNSINEIRFFQCYPWLKRKFLFFNDRYIKTKNKVTRRHVFWNSIGDIFRSGVYIIILLITARQIFTNPAVGIGAFVLVFTMASQLQEVVTQILVTAAQFVSDAAYIRDFFYLDELDYEKRRRDAAPREKFDIEFSGVSFTYPNTEREVLHDLNVRIREGEKVAIVGENGSGKSTFVNLLCALYEPNSGAVTMGGEDIHANLSATRKTLSAVFQDFAKYEASIRENIVVSDSRRKDTDEQLRSLAERTGAWEFIEPQPEGLDEIVGSFSASGNNLSGGQWQKIALTRCAYREDAKIMVLDEPTAALDPLAEAELYRSFAELTGDRTTILISHRLGITQLVDRILVFDDGRIVEDGAHAELLAKGGLYAKMYRAQAQWYE
ncbi:MAG: ABC transporter ATP-binding protein/permease [Oscillospiraceae bacterium]|jgi:ABC-type multidrug transport system fused ATPase/permease subunit|nr:ABC transporter ATP-binding protein/permease [Oscillospiraceae bacterium]